MKLFAEWTGLEPVPTDEVELGMPGTYANQLNHQNS